jgi:hypothetical protein
VRADTSSIVCCVLSVEFCNIYKKAFTLCMSLF